MRTVLMIAVIGLIGCAKVPDTAVKSEVETLKAENAELKREIKDLYNTMSSQNIESMKEVWQIQSDAIGEGEKLKEYNRCSDACVENYKNDERDYCFDKCSEDDKLPLVVKASC